MLVIEYYVGNQVEASNLGILGSRNFFSLAKSIHLVILCIVLVVGNHFSVWP